MQMAATGYACLRGGAPERLTGLALLVAAIASGMVQPAMTLRYAAVEIPVLAVDIVLLGIMIVITLFADRYWPAWATALHALATASHLVRAVSPDIARLVYAILNIVWSYPIILLLIIGTLRHAHRLRSKGWDLDWSLQDPMVR